MPPETLRFTLANSLGHDGTQLPVNVGAQFSACEFCNAYKLIAQPHAASHTHASVFGGRVLIDDLGPFPVKCIVTGATYVRKFTDEATNHWAAYPIVLYNVKLFFELLQFDGKLTIQVLKIVIRNLHVLVCYYDRPFLSFGHVAFFYI